MMRKLFKKINDLSIRYKLFITYLGLLALPICLLLAANLYYSSQVSEQQSKYTVNQVLNQTKAHIDFNTASINTLVNILIQNDTLQDILHKDKAYYENIGYWMLDNRNLTKAMYFTYANSNIHSIHYYMREGLATAVTTDAYIPLDNVMDTEWYDQLDRDAFALSWVKTTTIDPEADEGYVSAVKGIIDTLNLGSTIGVVRLDIRPRMVTTMLDQSLITQSSSAYLINSNNELLYSSGTIPVGNTSALIDIISKSVDSEGSAAETVKINNQEYLMEAQRINYTDWRLVLLVPYKDILALNINIRNQMLLIFLIVAPLTLPLSLLVSNSLTKRILKLMDKMKQVEQGNFDVSVSPGNNDEIGKLSHSFNFMLKKMEGLMEDKFQLGREVKNLELKALQAQINPHFLYNTLDLINWMALRKDAPEIGLLTENLSKFYKLSLSHGEDIVTIGNEIEHVKSYVQIQNMRYDNNITLEVDVPEELLQYTIVKLVMQPIVENAIIHGIFEKKEEKGIIRIFGEMKEGTIYLSIQDDGIGITDKRIREVLSGESTREWHGYGVHNINGRLQLQYGNEYGLSFTSEIGRYTIATISIPAILEGE